MSAPCLSAGPSSGDPWTGQTLTLTEKPSGTSTSKVGLMLVPDSVAGYMNTPTRSGGSRDTVRTGAADAKHGSLQSSTPEASASVVLCMRCKRRPRRDAVRARLCEVCYCHDLARSLCVRCGVEKGAYVRGAKLCDNCDPIRGNTTFVGKPCRGCGGTKERGRGAFYCSACQEARVPRCQRCHVNPKRPEVGARLCEECKAGEAARQAEYKRQHLARKHEEAIWLTERAVAPTDHQRTKTPDVESFPNLPAGPLYDKINKLIASERGAVYAYMPRFLNPKGKPMADSVRGGVVRRLHISDKAFVNWGKPGSMVGFDIADDVLRYAGWNWFDVWDWDCPEAREAFESTRVTVEAIAA